jgi:hypothetical protein
MYTTALSCRRAEIMLAGYLSCNILACLGIQIKNGHFDIVILFDVIAAQPVEIRKKVHTRQLFWCWELIYKRYIRVVHSSHFWLIFGSFLDHFWVWQKHDRKME